jgi:hypothetical protein
MRSTVTRKAHDSRTASSALQGVAHRRGNEALLKLQMSTLEKSGSYFGLNGLQGRHSSPVD